jgi:hypothetical protein
MKTSVFAHFAPFSGYELNETAQVPLREAHAICVKSTQKTVSEGKTALARRWHP